MSIYDEKSLLRVFLARLDEWAENRFVVERFFCPLKVPSIKYFRFIQEWRFYCHLLFGNRVGEFDFPCMQRLAVKSFFATIQCIACQRMIQMAEMNPDLVGSPAFQGAADKCQVTFGIVIENPIMGDGSLAGR